MTNYTTANKVEDNRIMMIAILLGGSFLAVLNQTLLITATPHIMLEFDLTENTGQWVTTIFMLVNGIMIPITAFLMETFSTRRLFTTSMSLFVLGTIVCLFMLNFLMLLIVRIFSGTAAGFMLLFMS